MKKKNIETVKTIKGDQDPYDIAYLLGWRHDKLRNLIFHCYKTPDLVQNARRFYESLEFNEAVRILKQLLPHTIAANVLDIGCGNGIACYALARKGYIVTGIDSSTGRIAGINAAKQLIGLDNTNFNIEYSSGENLNFKDSSFDIVWLRETLHHIKNLKGFMEEVRRILKISGIMCCFRDHVIWNDEQKQHFFDSHPFNHITKDEGCYRLEEYLEAFQSAGFKMEYVLDPVSSIINTYPAPYQAGLKFDYDAAKQRKKGNDLFSFFARKTEPEKIKQSPASAQIFSYPQRNYTEDIFTDTYQKAKSLAVKNRFHEAIEELIRIDELDAPLKNKALHLKNELISYLPVRTKPELCLSTIKSFFHDSEIAPDILVLGDSVMDTVSNLDDNKTNLRRMILKRKIKKHSRIRFINHAGYNPCVFWLILNVIKIFVQKPKQIILPINLRSFSSCWALHPFHHKTDTIKELRDYLLSIGIKVECLLSDTRLPYKEYLDTNEKFYNSKEKSLSILEHMLSQKGKVDQKDRYKTFFEFHYTPPINSDNRNLIFLQKFFKLASEIGISVYSYLTPINFQAGEKYAGAKFLPAVQGNTAFLLKHLPSCNTNDIIVHDFSVALPANHFIHPNESAEHLNYLGRKFLANKITTAMIL